MFQFPASPSVGQTFTPLAGVTYSWNGTGWVLLSNAPAQVFPTGIVLPYAAPVGVPAGGGWLLCDGASYPTATYAALFGIIGYIFGGAGPNFNVPDLRGRVIAAVDNYVGSGMGAANRLTIFGNAVAGAGGAEQIALSAVQLAAHAHVGGVTVGVSANHTHSGTTGNENAVHTHTGITDIEGQTHTHSGVTVAGSYGGAINVGHYGQPGVGVTGTQNANHTHSFSTSNESPFHQHAFSTGIENASHTHAFDTTSAGNNAPHNNVQPTMMMLYIIKT